MYYIVHFVCILSYITSTVHRYQIYYLWYGRWGILFICSVLVCIHHKSQFNWIESKIWTKLIFFELNHKVSIWLENSVRIFDGIFCSIYRRYDCRFICQNSTYKSINWFNLWWFCFHLQRPSSHNFSIFSLHRAGSSSWSLKTLKAMSLHSTQLLKHQMQTIVNWWSTLRAWYKHIRMPNSEKTICV